MYEERQKSRVQTHTSMRGQQSLSSKKALGFSQNFFIYEMLFSMFLKWSVQDTVLHGRSQ